MASVYLFFFKPKTSYMVLISDWRSDVCSSDLELAHVDTDHGVAVVEQEFGEGFGQLRLADAGRAEKEETPQRPVRVLQPGTAASDGSGHGLYRVRLDRKSVV